MLKFLLRRFANYFVLVALATCLGYGLAAYSLNPRSNYELRNPHPSEASINAKLDELNLNNHTPIVKRFTTWAGNAFHGDFGKTIDERPLWAEMKRRMGVSLRLLLIGSVIGAPARGGLGGIRAVQQYSLAGHVTPLGAVVLPAAPAVPPAGLLEGM